MATISNSYVAANIMVGPADIYLGIPAPTTATTPTQANEVALDANGQPATVSAAISAATNATPIVLTFANFSGYTPKNGDIAIVSGVGGNTNANNTTNNPAWTLSNVTVAGTTTATLLGSQGNSNYTSGGTITIGQHLGLSEGPVQLNITIKQTEIRADQLETAVDAAVQSVECEIDINLLEFQLLNIQRWFMNDNLTNPAWLSATNSALQLGWVQNSAGDADTLRSMMIVSPNRAVVGKWIYIFAFKVYLASAIQLTFHRTSHNVFKCKFKAIADLTRNNNDCYLHLVKTK